MVKKLNAAIEKGIIQQVTALLELNPELINTKDEFGYLPIHQAAKKDNKEMVELLLQKGADINSVTDTAMTPLHISASLGYKELAELLLEKGADVDGREEGMYSALHYASTKGIADMLISKGADVNVTTFCGSTPLHWAVMFGRKDVVETLLSHGANPKAKDKDGITPIQWADKKARESSLPTTDIIIKDKTPQERKEIARLLRGGNRG